jgi:hypothetical protein
MSDSIDTMKPSITIMTMVFDPNPVVEDLRFGQWWRSGTG